LTQRIPDASLLHENSKVVEILPFCVPAVLEFNQVIFDNIKLKIFFKFHVLGDWYAREPLVHRHDNSLLITGHEEDILLLSILCEQI
jgi:hypothetical protein